MLSLAEFQAEFYRALRDPQRPLPRTICDAAVTGSGLDVHRNNRAAGLVDSLEGLYPEVERLAGSTFFRAAARAFIDDHPPRSPVLAFYGGGFAEFLERLPGLTTAPYLGDVARLEWSCHESRHAAEATPAAVAELGGIDPELLTTTRLVLHPSVRMVASRWPVVSIWRGGRADLHIAETALVVRPALTVHVHALAPGYGAFLAELAEGATLEAAAASAMDAADGFVLAEAIRLLFASGAVASVETTGGGRP